MCTREGILKKDRALVNMTFSLYKKPMNKLNKEHKIKRNPYKVRLQH